MQSDSELFGDGKVQLMVLTGLITCQDYERAGGNQALGMEANCKDTMDDVFYS